MNLDRIRFSFYKADEGLLFGIWYPNYVLSWCLKIGFGKYRIRIDYEYKEKYNYSSLEQLGHAIVKMSEEFHSKERIVKLKKETK